MIKKRERNHVHKIIVTQKHMNKRYLHLLEKLRIGTKSGAQECTIVVVCAKGRILELGLITSYSPDFSLDSLCHCAWERFPLANCVGES